MHLSLLISGGGHIFTGFIAILVFSSVVIPVLNLAVELMIWMSSYRCQAGNQTCGSEVCGNYQWSRDSQNSETI